METPDGQEFTQETQTKPVATAARAMGGSAMMLLRAVGKIIITTWRLAAALDSALWRALKLLGRRALRGLDYAGRLAGAAFRGFVLWLPTRTGRAYSAMSGAFLVVAGLWIIDVLRAAPSMDGMGTATLRPPVDVEDPILARIEGRYVHLSEIEAAARAGGFLKSGEVLTPFTAFERNLVESYVEQRLLARAALDDGLQRNPNVARKVNAARDRVLASAYMDAQLQTEVTPQAVERLYTRQSDVTRLGDEVRARHIVVETGEEAAEIITLLEEGADFGALARERSIDRATAPVGGEVGWFTRSMMTPIFSRAAFNTEPGLRAPAFQTEFGWHILEVLDRRSTESVPFDDVRTSIEDFLRMHTIETALRELEERNQVVYFRPEVEFQTTSEPPDLRDPEFVDGDEDNEEKSSSQQDDQRSDSGQQEATR
ncbi:peptidylprolyl isomerase [Hyphococcus flavus]|uniref:Parvulin-like PPIase n=1 Tax=Hyphococcus flavus TaxID=1866326 RepID=A0AAF0CGC2_9PROT|nr:peptidylprolyl isomerase [Hyphococcus flavus]WDI30492.1 peptidylprolyl isomerase [Hyphococcus flavus]